MSSPTDKGPSNRSEAMAYVQGFVVPVPAANKAAYTNRLNR